MLYFVFLSNHCALSCPSYLFGEDLASLVGSARKDIFLFALSNEDVNSWVKLPLQIDPVDNDGHIIFSENIQNLLEKPLVKEDRMIFYTKDFGRPIRSGDIFPCNATSTLIKTITSNYEIQDSLFFKKYAYLGFCKESPDKAIPQTSSEKMNFNLTERRVESDRYVYFFSSDNHMLFNKILFKVNESESEAVIKQNEIANSSDMIIRADIRNFFLMMFGKHDVESELESYMKGPIALSAKVSFFLKILFFRIKLQLSTDVSFFPDSANIPMMVTIPVDAKKYLHPKSGILYSWNSASNIEVKVKESQMPFINPELFDNDRKKLQKIGLKRCVRDYCFYRAEFILMGHLLAMNFTLPRYLVEKGFFPFYVPNIYDFSEKMGWTTFEKQENVSQPKKIGMYFETSGLPEGNHPWDFWMTLGTKKNTWQASCPHPVKLKKM